MNDRASRASFIQNGIIFTGRNAQDCERHQHFSRQKRSEERVKCWANKRMRGKKMLKKAARERCNGVIRLLIAPVRCALA